jgi:hypothetical protein
MQPEYLVEAHDGDDGLEACDAQLAASPQARNGVVTDVVVAGDLARGLPGGHALDRQAALMLGQLEGWSHLHAITHGKPAALSGAGDDANALAFGSPDALSA